MTHVSVINSASELCFTLLWGVFVLQCRLQNHECDHFEDRGLGRRLRVGIGGCVRGGSRECFRRSDLVAGIGGSGAEDEPEKYINLPCVFLRVCFPVFPNLHFPLFFFCGSPAFFACYRSDRNTAKKNLLSFNMEKMSTQK